MINVRYRGENKGLKAQKPEHKSETKSKNKGRRLNENCRTINRTAQK